ncbi:MAG: cbb3-type cytochrome c oxidase subunit I [Betaproteobacteria bacterium]|nr:cbb3-type cytochrome c oxidase subunit I [Betaproteobacteria bacterium]
MFSAGVSRIALILVSAASARGGASRGRPVLRLDRDPVAGAHPMVRACVVRGGVSSPRFSSGGLTGVMLAVVPFDWQAHDTYFVVAHLHYVLIGGMVFPLFAGLYYWAPLASRRPLSERLGRWACATTFAGITVTFLPMHLTGLLGMPRQVHTYLRAGLGRPESSFHRRRLRVRAGRGPRASGSGATSPRPGAANRTADGREPVAGQAPSNGSPGGNYMAFAAFPRIGERYPLWDRPDSPARWSAANIC